MQKRISSKAHISWVVTAIVTCAILLVSELFIFNLPYWRTRDNQPHTITDILMGDGITHTNEGYLVTESAQNFLEFRSKSIEYIRINPTAEKTDSTFRFQLIAQHEGNAGWYTGQLTRYYNAAFPATYYVHVGNKTNGVRLEFKQAENKTIPIGSITINPVIPFKISMPRITIEFLLLVFFLIFRPKSGIYHLNLPKKILDLRNNQFWILAALTIIQFTIATAIVKLAAGNGAMSAWPNHAFNFAVDYDQYARLGDALIHGRTNLDLPVPDELAQMPNPYDSDLRGQVAGRIDTPIYWDHAFYKGKYYCYFGVVPAILFFIPYQLLTGKWLSSAYAVLALGCMASLFATVLAVQAAKKFFNNKASIGVVCLASMILTLGSSMYYQLFTPNFYAVPGIASLAFTYAGLSFWLMAKKGKALSKTYIALGSLCIALNLGCRPQFILVAVLALPLFWDELVKERLFFSRKGIGNTVAAFAPFIAVFAPLLAYNKARFGSLFDFGANYNLTGFDMNVMKCPPQNIIPLIYYYLFQPMNITAEFPFAHQTQTSLSLWSPAEPSIGGIFALCPFLLICTGALLQKHQRKLIRRITLSFLALAAFILLVDCYMTGLAWRYYLDFSWAVCFVCALLLYVNTGTEYESALDKFPSKTFATRRHFIAFVSISILLSAIFQFFGLFTTTRLSPAITIQPATFFDVMSWFLAFN